MNTASSTLNPTDGFLIRRWGLWDLGFGLLAALGAAFATQRYAAFMDIYELVILWCCVPAAVLLGYFWAALRPFFIGCAAASILAVAMYGGTAASAESNFLLKYFLASQSAILWMCALFAFATVSYWVGLFAQGRRPYGWAAC